ncbi:MAG: hopanoid biosynthesis-associated protein HpnK [Candidatus Binataceae bacterium]
MKAVIINGDDFGHSAEVNAGIIRAHRDGVLTSASLMVASPARDEAAAYARANPSLDVGLHLVVCKGRSVLAGGQLAGLVDSNGEFAANPVRAGLSYFFDRRARALLRAECRAQIKVHLALVGYLNHIDGHLNFHVHPTIADVIVELAAEYRVPCIRLPREPIGTTLALAKDNFARKLVEAVIFKALSKRTKRLLDAKGIKSTDALFGLHQSGHLTEEYVLGVVQRLRDGVTEIYFHPAIDPAGVAPSAEPQREVEILTGRALRDALDRNGIHLTTFRELAAT